MTEQITVTITCTPRAATSALLAIEGYAERVYSDRAADERKQVAYNELGDIVLPLRAARDAAYEVPAGACMCIGYDRRDCAAAEPCAAKEARTTVNRPHDEEQA